MENKDLNKDQLYGQALKVAALGTVVFPIVGQIVATSLLSKGFFKDGSSTASGRLRALGAASLVALYVAFLTLFVIRYRAFHFNVN